jgi:hypothetical protein
MAEGLRTTLSSRRQSSGSVATIAAGRSAGHAARSAARDLSAATSAITPKAKIAANETSAASMAIALARDSDGNLICTGLIPQRAGAAPQWRPAACANRPDARLRWR